MPIEDAYGLTKKHKVLNDTWGHLKPEHGYHKGSILLYRSAYASEIGLLSDSVEGIGSSPWWYNALSEFIWQDGVAESMPEPSVVRFHVSVWAKRDDTFTIRVNRTEQIQGITHG